ncbi:hypothetical protein PHLCEN_2v2760 [Hermanssonia centrifuga]|uniref:Uncharacterized protein n=1 Tax=Hermanssonia centrifuga TaxID=98765 RepID=A0A2R6RHW3_9APHY|nr:hypothetical protein PHLCEN_2v2760 [Hermanssonia centrifuga]
MDASAACGKGQTRAALLEKASQSTIWKSFILLRTIDAAARVDRPNNPEYTFRADL